jgi:hypothetical protein
MPSWVSPLQSVPSSRLSPPLRARGGSLHTLPAVRRPTPPASRGLEVRETRLVPLGTAGSPGVLHLPTVTEPLRSPRGAGSWFRLTADARCRRRPPICAPSKRRPGPGSRPDPAPPSFGERLLPLPIVRTCFQRTQPQSHGACHGYAVPACRRRVPLNSLSGWPLRRVHEDRISQSTFDPTRELGIAVPATGGKGPGQSAARAVAATRCVRRAGDAHVGHQDSHAAWAGLPRFSTDST